MIDDHEQDIANDTKASGGNDEVAKYAKDTLPVLQKHLKLAEGLKSGDKGASRKE